MTDNACLAVHRIRRIYGPASEGLVDALHAQTDAQYGDPVGKAFDKGHGYARMGRVPGAGADKYIIRGQVLCLAKGYHVSPVHMDAEIIGHEHLNEIICKGIVIIYDKQSEQG